MIRNFKDLKVWQKSHELTLRIYRITEHYPKIEIFGLVSQMRRCSVSVAANIAEGSGKQTTPELCRFLDISVGSLEELKYYLILGKDLKFIDEEHYNDLVNRCEEIGKMIYGLQTSLKHK